MISIKRLSHIAIIVKPATLLKFHKALVKRKYHLLFSNKSIRKPGPKGPSQQLIDAIVEMKIVIQVIIIVELPCKYRIPLVWILIKMLSEEC